MMMKEKVISRQVDKIYQNSKSQRSTTLFNSVNLCFIENTNTFKYSIYRNYIKKKILSPCMMNNCMDDLRLRLFYKQGSNDGLPEKTAI